MDSGFLDRSVSVDGEDRRYVVSVPFNCDRSKPQPAILFLHGRGECGRDGLFQLFNGLMPAIVRNRSEWPFLCIYPQKGTQDSEWFEERPLLDAILAAVDQEFKVDPHRRYLTGLSQGGRGTLRLAKHLRWQFAAIAAVCGWADASVAGRELADLPVWLFHGEDDLAVPPKGSKDVHAAILAANGDSKLTLYPGVGHNSWDRAYRDEKLSDWFLSHALT